MNLDKEVFARTLQDMAERHGVEGRNAKLIRNVAMVLQQNADALEQALKVPGFVERQPLYGLVADLREAVLNLRISTHEGRGVCPTPGAALPTALEDRSKESPVERRRRFGNERSTRFKQKRRIEKTQSQEL